MVKPKKSTIPQKTILINGVFDIVHPGHIQLLKFGKSLGGRLIVALNSDRVVKILKGESRPINDQEARKAFLEALGFIDTVVIFDDVRIGAIVRRLRPDILVRGDEHTREQIIDTDGLPSDTNIKLFPKIPGFSTTNIVKKIREDIQQ